MKQRRYGDVKTHLALSSIAQELYDYTDDCDIYEIEQEDGTYRYHFIICGDPWFNLTEKELNELMEELFIYDAEELRELMMQKIHEDVPFLEWMSDLELCSMNDYDHLIEEAEKNIRDLTPGEVKELCEEWNIG